MKNVNINLTTIQAKQVDRTTKDYGFANRSEFFRAVLRYIFSSPPETLEQVSTLNFRPPPIKDIDKIMKDFRGIGKYNEKFLKSLEQGLRKSHYFNE